MINLPSESWLNIWQREIQICKLFVLTGKLSRQGKHQGNSLFGFI